MNKKIMKLIFLLTFITLITSISFAEASTHLIVNIDSSNAVGAQYLSLNHLHPSDESNRRSLVGTTFLGDGSYLASVTFWAAYRDGVNSNFAFTLKARLYNCTGAYGSAEAIDTLLEETTETITSLDETADPTNTSSYGEETLHFTGTTTLTANAVYAVVIVLVAGNNVTYTVNDVHLLSDSTDLTFPGRMVQYVNSDWSFTAANDVCLLVTGTDTLGETAEATPAPLPTWAGFDTSDPDANYAAAVAFLIPVIVMLTPAFLLWFLGGRGKWSLLIGLAIGTGLGYMFGFVPPWLVFLVAVGVIGMAYSDVSSGGSYT